MTLFNLYILIGFAYTFYLWQWATPEEEKQVANILDVANMVSQALGATLIWPLVVYINHFWGGPSDSDGES